MDIYGDIISNAICSTTYHNAVGITNYENSIGGFGEEEYKKQERYVNAFNDIFGYTGLEEFKKAMEKVHPSQK